MNARRRTAKPAAFTVTAAPAEPGTDEPAGGPDAQTTDTLAATAGEGQKAPRARIVRWNENMRSFATIDLVTAEVVDEAWIREEYGGGKYRVYYWGTRNDGTYGYLEKIAKEFIIDDSIPFKGAPHKRAANGAVHNPDGSVVGAPAGSTLMDMGMLQLFKTMQDNSTLMMQQARDHSAAQTAMLERLAAPRDNGLVPLLAALTPLLTPLVAGLVQRKDPMDTARELAALMKPDAGERGTVKETIGAFRELMEVRDLLNPNGGGDGEGGEGRWFSLLEKVIPGALDVLKTEAAKRGVPLARVGAPAVPPAIAAPPAPPVVAVPDPSPAEAPVSDEWSALEPYVARLAQMAANNKAPFGVMQTIVTIAPAPMVAAIRELVARDDAVPMLTHRFPALQPYTAWTAQLVEEFRNEFFGEADEDGPPDAPADGATGAPAVEG